MQAGNFDLMRPTIVKLGGSAITNKSRNCTPNLRLIDGSIDQIASFRKPLILLHGGGSFAHPFVTRAALQNGYKGRFQLNAISETELYLDQLTRIIGVGLLLKRRPFVPISPMSFITLRNGRALRTFIEPIRRAAELGLIPLIHGDLVFDSRLGIAVLSADKLASFLGRTLKASRVLFGCDVDGVYSQDPKISPGASLIEEVTRANYKSILKSLSKKKGFDATGGMLGKISEAIELARNGVESIIFNLARDQRLKGALRGRQIRGTRFIPWEDPTLVLPGDHELGEQPQRTPGL